MSTEDIVPTLMTSTLMTSTTLVKLPYDVMSCVCTYILMEDVVVMGRVSRAFRTYVQRHVSNMSRFTVGDVGDDVEYREDGACRDVDKCDSVRHLQQPSWVHHRQKPSKEIGYAALRLANMRAHALRVVQLYGDPYETRSQRLALLVRTASQLEEVAAIHVPDRSWLSRCRRLRKLKTVRLSKSELRKMLRRNPDMECLTIVNSGDDVFEENEVQWQLTLRYLLHTPPLMHQFHTLSFDVRSFAVDEKCIFLHQLQTLTIRVHCTKFSVRVLASLSNLETLDLEMDLSIDDGHRRGTHATPFVRLPAQLRHLTISNALFDANDVPKLQHLVLSDGNMNQHISRSNLVINVLRTCMNIQSIVVSETLRRWNTLFRDVDATLPRSMEPARESSIHTLHGVRLRYLDAITLSTSCPNLTRLSALTSDPALRVERILGQLNKLEHLKLVRLHKEDESDTDEEEPSTKETRTKRSMSLFLSDSKSVVEEVPRLVASQLIVLVCEGGYNGDFLYYLEAPCLHTLGIIGSVRPMSSMYIAPPDIDLGRVTRQLPSLRNITIKAYGVFCTDFPNKDKGPLLLQNLQLCQNKRGRNIIDPINASRCTVPLSFAPLLRRCRALRHLGIRFPDVPWSLLVPFTDSLAFPFLVSLRFSGSLMDVDAVRVIKAFQNVRTTVYVRWYLASTETDVYRLNASSTCRASLTDFE
jgi:hypothetical protein